MIVIECGVPSAAEYALVARLRQKAGLLLVRPSLPANEEGSAGAPEFGLVWISAAGVLLLEVGDEDAAPEEAPPLAGVQALRSFLEAARVTQRGIKFKAVRIEPSEKQPESALKTLPAPLAPVGAAWVRALLGAFDLPESLTLSQLSLVDEGFALGAPLGETSSAQLQALVARQQAGTLSVAEQARLDQLERAARSGQRIVTWGVILLVLAIAALLLW